MNDETDPNIREVAIRPPGGTVADRSFLNWCRADIRDMVAYWNRVRGERRMPRRADINPMEIPQLLPGLVLVDVAPDRNFIYRVVGTEVLAFRGNVDPTGKTVADAGYGMPRDAVTSIYTFVAHRRNILFDPRPWTNAHGETAEGETVFMPLSEDGRTVSQILVYASRGNWRQGVSTGSG